MTDSPSPSFEILHLVSALLVRFNSICKDKCKLNPQKIYLLAYINSHGEMIEGNKTILREDATKILREVFSSNDTTIGNWIDALYARNLLRSGRISSEDKKQFFSKSKGARRDTLCLTQDGQEVVTDFVKELELIRNKITEPNSNLLLPPDMNDYGRIAKSLVWWLENWDTIKLFSQIQ